MDKATKREWAHQDRVAKLEAALKVLVLTAATREWLKAHDPKALEQAERALGLHHVVKAT